MADFQEYVEYTEEQGGGVSSKQKVVTGLLAIFLGCYGVDQFYLGKVVPGIISIAITIVSSMIGYIVCFIGGFLSLYIIGLLILPFGFLICLIPYVWPIIRAIKAFTGKEVDAQGNMVVN